MPSSPHLLVDYRLPGDEALFHLLNGWGSPALDPFWQIVTHRLFGVAVVAVTLGVLVWKRRRRAWPVLIEAALTLTLSDAFGHHVLKRLFQRMRPAYALEEGSFLQLAPVAQSGSLPSLHAANGFAFALLIAFHTPRRAWPWLFGLAGIIALSRVVVGVHWPSDTLLGIAWGLFCAALVHGLSTRLRRRFGRG